MTEEQWSLMTLPQRKQYNRLVSTRTKLAKAQAEGRDTSRWERRLERADRGFLVTEAREAAKRQVRAIEASGVDTGPLDRKRILEASYAAVGLPHPDASNQELGPNLGGADAVNTVGDEQAAQQMGGAIAGAGLVAVAVVVFVLIAGGRK